MLESNGLQTVAPIPIEDINEGDFVMSQVNGKIDFAEVFLVRKYENHEGDIIRFILEDDQSLEVTPNHCMLVASDEGPRATKSYAVKLAQDVKEGDKFLNSGGLWKEITKVEILENKKTDVYDIITPSFNVLANDFLVSTYG